MAKLSYKFSYRILYVLFAIIIVVLGLFYFVGYNNPVGEYNAPKHAETLIILMYALAVLAFIMFILGKFTHLVSLLKNEPKQGIRFLIFDIALIALLAITWAIGSTDPVTLTDGTVFSDGSMIKLTDCMLNSLYVLLIVGVVGLLLNLSGVFKRIK
jgi:membrane protease YdiL (CAAX protease family)